MKRSFSTEGGDNSEKKSRPSMVEHSFEDDLMEMDDLIGATQGLSDYDNDITGSQEDRWHRPDCSFLRNDTNIEIQWMDIDMTSGPPLSANPSGGEFVGLKTGPVPIIRMYGVSRDGFSVMVCVHGYIPYFFVSLPSHVHLPDISLEQLRSHLDQRVLLSLLFANVIMLFC